MVLKEFIRCFKAKSNIILLILLTALCIPSFLSSMATKDMIAHELVNPVPDLSASSLRHMEELARNYTGIRFFFDYISLSEFYTYGYILLLMAWVGIFLSSAMHMQKESGQGNLIMTRTTYKRYTMTVLGAQSLYIASLVFISTLISFALGLIVGGTYFETILIGDRYLSLPSALLVIAVQTILLVLFVCIVNAICSLTSLSIRNRYVLQALPLCGFTLLPFVLCSTIANIYPAIGKILLPFIPFAFSQCVMDSLNTNMSTDAFIKIIIPLAVYLATALALRHKNIKTNENGYV